MMVALALSVITASSTGRRAQRPASMQMGQGILASPGQRQVIAPYVHSLDHVLCLMIWKTCPSQINIAFNSAILIQSALILFLFW